MIDETTWHRNPDEQTCFVWSATSDGIRLHHSTETPSYLIRWPVFYDVFQYARNLALNNNGVVTAGISQNMPPPGSVGEWVLTQNLAIENGNLTPRHLSFIGPILGHMGFITRGLNGNAIQWVFK